MTKAAQGLSLYYVPMKSSAQTYYPRYELVFPGTTNLGSVYLASDWFFTTSYISSGQSIYTNSLLTSESDLVWFCGLIQLQWSVLITLPPNGLILYWVSGNDDPHIIGTYSTANGLVYIPAIQFPASAHLRFALTDYAEDIPTTTSMTANMLCALGN